MATSVVKVNISLTSYDLAIAQISRWVNVRQSRYVCHANVHMILEAYDSPEFRRVVNQADLVTPDGMPLVWMMRLKGIRAQKRVYGPTLMLHVLGAAQDKQVPVGFYGASPQVLDLLIGAVTVRYPELKVAYFFSPPYRDLDSTEDAEVIRAINDSGTRILFVGLGCPKQELWMAAHRGKVNAVMFGVGAAFDFHAGVKSQAPVWIQAIGLEWLYRLLSEPRRLWRRYLHNNPRFVFLAVADILGILR